MIDDDIRALREAIAAGPTPGPWELVGTVEAKYPHDDVIPVSVECASYCYGGTPTAPTRANLRYIAACSPDRIARLLDEVERLRADATRYRWLRGDSCMDHSARWTQWEVRLWDAPIWTNDLRRADLDAAIDDAMRKEPDHAR